MQFIHWVDLFKSVQYMRCEQAFSERLACRRRVDLERLDEGPEQRADALATTQQLDDAHHAEQTKEVDADYCRPARLQQQQQQSHGSLYHTVSTYKKHVSTALKEPETDVSS